MNSGFIYRGKFILDGIKRDDKRINMADRSAELDGDRAMNLWDGMGNGVPFFFDSRFFFFAQCGQSQINVTCHLTWNCGSLSLTLAQQHLRKWEMARYWISEYLGVRFKSAWHRNYGWQFRLLYVPKSGARRRSNWQHAESWLPMAFSSTDIVYTYIHACIHACMHTYIHPCIHTCMHTYIHPCIHTCMHT